MSAQSRPANPKNQYRALQIVSIIYIIFGMILLFVSIVAGGLVMTSPSLNYNAFTGEFEQGGANILGGLPIIIGGVLGALSLFAIGQLIQVVRELVFNSRTQAEMMTRVAKSLAKRDL